ncbi:hypothetical protein D3C77_571010 [compost metagenome]
MMLVAGTPANVTSVTPTKLVPVRVTEVPPMAGPLPGDTAVRVRGGVAPVTLRV